MGLKKRAAAPWATIERYQLRKAEKAARDAFPGAWLAPIKAQAMRARAVHMRHAAADPIAAREVWEGWLREYGGALAADLSDGQIKARALDYENEAVALDIGQGGAGRWAELARLVDFCRARGVDCPPVALGLEGMAARVRCRYWWRRVLRRMVAQRCERGAIALGLVNKPAGQAYCSDSAVLRRIDQNRRNAQAMAGTWLRNDAGQRASLADLAARSVSNKTIRRGELMTRIRGCEEIADECGHVGLFLTLTVPSRFHAVKWDGTRNKKHKGETPADAQRWLCDRWALARAALARAGCKVYGFRVAEPHHDGTTHWHALMWTAGDVKDVERVIRHYWTSCEPERGSSDYRVNVKRMEKGGAAGYVAKYVAKNIDDCGIESHLDDYTDKPIGPDLLGDLVVLPSMRVEAWASLWRIRQFQALGQPPVTVWRELRRLDEKEARASGYGGPVHKAWQACQRSGLVLASWSRYVKAQGGMCKGRGHWVKMAADKRDVSGRYGPAVRREVLGVVLNAPAALVAYTQRRCWEFVPSERAGEGDFLERETLPRTRVNNCTRHNRRRVGPLVEMQEQREARRIFEAELKAIRERDYTFQECLALAGDG